MSDKTPRTSEQVYENNITTPQGEDFCRRLEKSRRKNIHRAWKFRNLMRAHRFERDRFIDQKIRLDAEFSVTENAMEHFHDEWLKAKADLAAANARAEAYKQVAGELAGFIQRLSVYREYDGKDGHRSWGDGEWLYPNEAIYHGSHPIPEAALAKLEPSTKESNL